MDKAATICFPLWGAYKYRGIKLQIRFSQNDEKKVCVSGNKASTCMLM